MKLYTFESDGRERFGAERDGRIVELGHACPGDLMRFIQGGEASMSAARDALRSSALTHEFDAVRLRTPLPRPGKILCSGVNYRGHLEENPKATLPEEPFFFAKLPSAVIGPGESIVLPRTSAQVDYEVELAVVIGRRMRDAAPSEVMAGIFGYTILHDVSARDVQFKDSQITLGKNFDTFAPIGPCIVTRNEVPEPESLRLRATISGETLQDGTTRDWIFPLPELIAALSRVMTLSPGDIVTTGTPAGVGYFRRPQRFLRPGDTCVLEVERIGRLENPVVAERGR